MDLYCKKLMSRILSCGKILLAVMLFCTAMVAGAQEVKVMSFNIRYNPYYKIDGENCWDNRRDAVVKMIRKEAPAAIGLQEALIDQLSYLDKHLGNYRRVGVGRDNGRDEGEFMAIYYDVDQLELVCCNTRWLSNTPDRVSMGWDAACKRTVTIARFRVKATGKEFYYLNTHLDHVGKVARAESARLIASLIAQRAVDTIPLIVGGDMNSTIDDTIFNSFYGIGLQAARDMARSTSHAITYNAFGKGDGSVIDHFFVRNLYVKRFRTLNRNYGVPYISDHYPIEILIDL